MGQALYRKYRSRKFSEVVGQDHITSTLKKAIKTGRVSHAYLFSGPRGVGKTSVARILAHEVNNLAYNDDSIHLDIIEIDAASNRRIDEIRDLREKIHLAPTSAKYKIYIIDEVHMLTGEAFNALLKTLEEPPAHCIFILATTEAHKLPETIVSRTQHFTFKPIDSTEAAEHLKTISKEEEIDIEPAALELLAKHGSGSFRDSISLLDQLSARGSLITPQVVERSLGLPPEEAISELVKAIKAGDSQRLVQELDGLKVNGASAPAVCQALSRSLRTALVASGKSPDWMINLLNELLDVPASSQPFEKLEIVLLQAAAANSLQESTTATAPEVNSPKVAAPDPLTKPKKLLETPKATVKPLPSGSFSLELWPEVISGVKAKAASIYTALRLANPRIDGDKLILSFKFPLHQKKLSKAENLKVIEQTIEEVSGARLRVECIVGAADPLEAVLKQPAAPDELESRAQTISNIFGSAEVLES